MRIGLTGSSPQETTPRNHDHPQRELDEHQAILIRNGRARQGFFRTCAPLKSPERLNKRLRIVEDFEVNIEILYAESNLRPTGFKITEILPDGKMRELDRIVN